MTEENMMKLFIETDRVTGEPLNHPLLEQNLLDCGIDPRAESSPYREFKRVEQVSPGWQYQYVRTDYVRDGDVFRDEHVYRQLTEEEQTAYHEQQLAEGRSIQATGRYTTWQYSRTAGTWLPPQGVIPDEAILEGKRVTWNDQENRFDIE